MMTKKETYRKLCTEEKDIPIFSKDWWLDACCGADNWDVSLIEKDGQVIASMPYYIKKRMGLTLITQPPLTQKLGPWIRRVEKKDLISHEHKIMDELIAQLPKYSYFRQGWDYKYTNWLPFYWRGYHQTTRYTYVIDDLSDEEKIWKNMNTKVRMKIRKAEKKYHFQIRNDLSIDDFLLLNEHVFKRQGLKAPYSKEYVRRLDEACRRHNCREILIAQNAEGLKSAGVYIIWDYNSAYLLMSGIDSDSRSTNVMSLLVWESIRRASKVTKKFDFEGSMIRGVERFSRSYGSRQAQYFNISHTPSRMLKAYLLFSKKD